MPYVVFIAAPELETLRAMHKAVVDAGITTKLLTVSQFFLSYNSVLNRFFLNIFPFKLHSKKKDLSFTKEGAGMVYD